jgi:hypothetical protein
MEMKQILLIILVTFQTIVFSAAQAWSPLDSVKSFTASSWYCDSVIAGSEESQEGDKKKKKEAEGEEEPDCD